MDINKFCVNDKTCGSCWGTLVAFDKLIYITENGSGFL